MTGRPGPVHPLLTGGEEYPFVTLERMRRELAPAGVPLIHFGMGDPREETPGFIRDALRAAVPSVSSYPTVAGQPELRAAAATWFARRFGVALDPERHILPANGTKEAVFLMAFAVIGPAGAGADARRTVVIPTPAYPVYEPGARFAGADVHRVALRGADGWRFDPARVPDDVWRRTAMLWLNSPHNPTGSVLDRAGYERVLAVARRFGFWVISDEAYSEVWFDRPPHTILECGLENAVALHTLSKRSAMTGYRSGFIAGDERLIEALRRFRPNVGVATPEFVQRAAIEAWGDDAHAVEQRGRYAAKRRLFLEYFARRGWDVEASEATFYLWMRVAGGDDVEFVRTLLKAGMVTTPGSFMGEGGEGFVRWALVPTLEQCREALARLDAVADPVAR
ncbi:MAG: aminotransferase class I/II-fold pyridoxal phosphate-dependent enzyme [Candidatus Eisenbacteria bacterium]|uniref:Aminotransferase class I/II-fold pyridoxal phosphate-dependent enzyme n=1 Tax=Eiseniibacteriota bacterium TaxID=2212470 RepID=A0A9D6L5K5_UNCEI|nr:aminotransferase class I/II-fold pyridoxal phosphate-dependent enzyme [Candidatus Eisenbacteria bacterium]